MTNPYRAMCAELLADYDNCHYRSELADRARALLAQPVAEGPTVMEIIELHSWLEDEWRANNDGEDLPTLDFARAVLARFGRPTPQPVAVKERLPGPEDCTTNPRTSQGQWCWGWVQHDPAPYSGRWRMMRREWLADEATHWLPANALPTPEATNE
jgi:hypothetical protein